jgi:PAS domain S-box-containing protein
VSVAEANLSFLSLLEAGLLFAVIVLVSGRCLFRRKKPPANRPTDHPGAKASHGALTSADSGLKKGWQSALISEAILSQWTRWDYQSILQEVASFAVPELADWCIVDRRDKEGKIETVSITHIDPKKLGEAWEFCRLFPPISQTVNAYGVAVSSGRSQLVSDMSRQMLIAIYGAGVGAYFESLPIRSTIIAPLQNGNTVVGIITFILSDPGKRYVEADRMVAEDFAAQVALLVDSSILYQQTQAAVRGRDAALSKLQKQIGQQAVLATISQRTMSSTDLPASLDDTVLWLARTLKTTFCVVLEWSTIQPRFVVKSILGWDSAVIEAYLDQPPIHQFLTEIIAKQEPLFFENGQRDIRLSQIGFITDFNLSSGILAPFKVSESDVGLIGVLSKDEMAFSQDDIQFLQSILSIFTASIKRVESEKAIQATEERYRQLFDLSPDGIIVVDLDYRITTVNPEALRMLGFVNAHEVVGCSVLKLVPVNSIRHAKQLAKQVSQSGKVRDAELMLRRRDGSRFPAEISADIIGNCDGTRSAFFGIIRDVTQRKELDEMKSEFIATVSHELRTPLTSIYISLGLLVSGKINLANSEVPQLIDVAHKNCVRLINLINDFLDLQKIEFGNLGFDMKPMDIADLVEQAVAMNRSYAEQYDVRFVLENLPSGAFILVDPERFHQVLTNLLSNAAKFSEKNHEVVIRASQQAMSVRLSVTNFGPPIPEKYQQKIFEKFVQASNNLRRKRDGTGLGLSISKGIIEKMGGQIGFVSAKNQTEFFLDFPLNHHSLVAINSA